MIVLGVEESEKTDALFKALMVFQEHAEPLLKTAENPHFRSAYADLAEVMRVARPAMMKAGLVLTQAMVIGEAQAMLCASKLVHVQSGQWMRSYHPLTPSRVDSQGIGSAYTYARRYAAMAILGLAPEDDDAEASQGRDTRPNNATRVTSAPSSSDVDRMIDAFAAIGVDIRELEQWVGGALVNLTAEQFAGLRGEYDKRKRRPASDDAARVLATTTRPAARMGKRNEQ